MSKNLKKNIFLTMEELFPICRSLTGEGVRKSLSILKKIVPLEIQEVPSGTQCFDWQVPDEWNVQEAYIENHLGERIVDFKNNNLHLVGYSIPFEGTLSLQELQEHLHSLPDQPDLIPYVTSYYSPRWGFCLSHHQRKKLTDGNYRVVVKTTLDPGSMTLASLVIPGESKQELLFSSYICHPSMANNELSGPVLMAYLAQELAKRPGRFTYRFVWVPETIGSLAYLSQNLDHLKKYVKGGYVFSCLGDRGNFSYLQTRKGNTQTDRLTRHCLSFSAPEYKDYDWLERGSDERQYNWPGIDLPIGVFMRSKFATYPEYHTSADDLSFVSADSLENSLEKMIELVDAWEANRTYRTTTLGEPQLGKRGLYPTLSTRDSGYTVRTLINLLALSDGETSLLSIAERLEIPIWELQKLVPELLEKSLLEEVD